MPTRIAHQSKTKEERKQLHHHYTELALNRSPTLGRRQYKGRAEIFLISRPDAPALKCILHGGHYRIPKNNTQSINSVWNADQAFQVSPKISLTRRHEQDVLRVLDHRCQLCIIW